jgi:hypothetical protein
MLRMTTTRWIVYAAALAGGLLLLAPGARAETQCTTRPAVGGGSITTCHEAGAGAPAREYRTRPAIGGGGTATTCR